MENGVGIVNESRLRDENLSSGGEEIITEGSEGDDVFEEAIAAEMPVVDSENVVIEGGDDKKMENLEARLEDDGNPNLGHETDKFEEAIEAPTESNKEEEPSVIDGVAAEEVMNGEDEITQTAETHDSGEMEMAEKSGLLIQKPENGVSDQIDADNHENQSHTEPEPVNTDKVEGVESVIGKNVESNGEILHEAEKKDEVTETKGILVTAQEEQTHTEPETIGTNRVEGVESGIGQNVESNGEILHEAEKKDEVNETTCILDTLQEEQSLTEPETIDTNKAEGVESDIGQNVESNGEILHEAEKNHELNEPPGILDTSHEEQTHTESEAIDTNEVEGISGSSQKVESNGEFLHKVEKKEEVNETPDILEAAHEEQTHSGAESRDTNEVDGVSGSSQKGKSNGEILHESKENVEVNESPSLLDKGEEMKEKLVTFETNLKEEKIEESKETAFGRPVPQIHDSKGSSGLTDVKTRSSTLNVGTGVSNTKEEEGKGSSSIKKPVNPPPAAARPAGLGRTVLPLEPIPRAVQQPRVNGAAPPPQNQLVEDSANGEAEENDETREKLQMIRVKFLRLARRLGQTPHNVVVAQVLYRLGLAEQLRGRNGGRVAAFSFDRASAMAEQLEAAGQEPLDFSCTIMVLGKTGVGKSATINSIFDEVKFGIDAFDLGTRKVQEVVGTVQGIKVRVIDTPGLLPSWSDQRQNEKILHSIKRFIKNTPPDIVLYLDRLDMQSRDFGDMPLLRTITEIFGPSIWFNAIVVLTHAASAPPEGPNGTATSYDMFVTQRSHVVQQAIRQAAGDMRLMNPVSLVENHLACRTNRAGQRVLPNGQVWKSHLLLLSFASKILAEANTLLKLQDSPPGKPFASRIRAPPLPFLLSSLLQSRPQVKLPSEQFGDDDDDALDDDSDESMLSDDDSEYDDLPPFKPLTKTQLSKLTKAQKKAYFDELEYREKLLMKKQLKEEKRRRRFMKKMADSVKDLPVEFAAENVEEENSNAASVPVPMPDLPLPASFDSDNPTHRYRCLDSLNQWLVRPVLENHGWDHDVGYEGINVEKLFVVKDKIPISFSGQVSKDKKDTNVQMDVASTLKHGDAKSTSVGFDVQTIGKDIAYTLRSDTRFTNYRHNRATAGLSVTLLGDVLTGGMKIEDKLVLSKRGQVVVSGGAIVGRGDVAYGGSLEATLRDKDHPLGRFLTTMGLSVMDWHGDLAVGGNAQTQIPIGRSTNLIGRVNFNNRGSGQVSVRLNSSEHLQIALVAVLPLLRKLFGYSLSGEFGQ